MITSLFGTANSPDIIIGKYDLSSINPELISVYGEGFFDRFNNIQINKYEFWFSSTVSFIPYSGQPVFITDTSGNVTHSGNLLTKGDAVVSKTLTVTEDTKLQKNTDVAGKLTVTNDIETKKDARVTGNLYVQGVIFNNAVGAGVTSDLEKIQKDIADIKAQLAILSAAK